MNNVLNVVVYDNNTESTTILTIPYSTELQIFTKNTAFDQLFSDLVLNDVKPEHNPNFLTDCISGLSYTARVFLQRGLFDPQTKIKCEAIPLLLGDGKMKSIMPLMVETQDVMHDMKKLAAYQQAFFVAQNSNGDLVKLRDMFINDQLEDLLDDLEISKSKIWFENGITNTFFNLELKHSIAGFEPTKEAFCDNFIDKVKEALELNDSCHDIALYLNGECFYSEIEDFNTTMDFVVIKKALPDDLFAGGLSCVIPLI